MLRQRLLCLSMFSLWRPLLTRPTCAVIALRTNVKTIEIEVLTEMYEELQWRK